MNIAPACDDRTGPQTPSWKAETTTGTKFFFLINSKYLHLLWNVDENYLRLHDISRTCRIDNNTFTTLNWRWGNWWSSDYLKPLLRGEEPYHASIAQCVNSLVSKTQIDNFRLLWLCNPLFLWSTLQLMLDVQMLWNIQSLVIKSLLY